MHEKQYIITPTEVYTKGVIKTYQWYFPEKYKGRQWFLATTAKLVTRIDKQSYEFNVLSYDIETRGEEPNRIIDAIGLEAGIIDEKGQYQKSWTAILSRKDSTEKAMLKRFLKIINGRDDTYKLDIHYLILLVGYNNYDFDSLVIGKRAQHFKLTGCHWRKRYNAELDYRYYINYAHQHVKNKILAFKNRGVIEVDLFQYVHTDFVLQQRVVKTLKNIAAVIRCEEARIDSGLSAPWYYDNDYAKFKSYLEEDIVDTVTTFKHLMPMRLQMLRYMEVPIFMIDQSNPKCIEFHITLQRLRMSKTPLFLAPVANCDYTDEECAIFMGLNPKELTSLEDILGVKGAQAFRRKKRKRFTAALVGARKPGTKKGTHVDYSMDYPTCYDMMGRLAPDQYNNESLEITRRFISERRKIKAKIVTLKTNLCMYKNQRVNLLTHIETQELMFAVMEKTQLVDEQYILSVEECANLRKRCADIQNTIKEIKRKILFLKCKEQSIKLILNTIYGTHGRKNNKKNQYVNTDISSRITGCARVLLRHGDYYIKRVLDTIYDYLRQLEVATYYKALSCVNAQNRYEKTAVAILKTCTPQVIEWPQEVIEIAQCSTDGWYYFRNYEETHYWIEKIAEQYSQYIQSVYSPYMLLEVDPPIYALTIPASCIKNNYVYRDALGVHIVGGTLKNLRYFSQAQRDLIKHYFKKLPTVGTTPLHTYKELLETLNGYLLCFKSQQFILGKKYRYSARKRNHFWDTWVTTYCEKKKLPAAWCKQPMHIVYIVTDHCIEKRKLKITAIAPVVVSIMGCHHENYNPNSITPDYAYYYLHVAQRLSTYLGLGTFIPDPQKKVYEFYDCTLTYEKRMNNMQKVNEKITALREKYMTKRKRQRLITEYYARPKKKKKIN